MHQMRISTNQVSSVVLSPKKVEIREKNSENCIRAEKNKYSLLRIYWNSGDQPFYFNISEFQYKRNLKQSAILHALFTWLQMQIRNMLLFFLSIHYYVY
jgi:hypothetical protein